MRALSLRPETWENKERHPVAGRISSRSFVLRKRLRYSNSFQTLVSGSFVTGAFGTRVEARFGVSVFAFMLVWFGGVGYVAFTNFLVALDRSVSPTALCNSIELSL